MKLVLCSQGLYTKEEIAKIEELVGKSNEDINVAVINEAYSAEKGGHRWVVDTLTKIGDVFGGNIELVNLLALDVHTVKQRIAQCDIIYVVGGHTDWLMRVFQKTGFDKLLPELLKTKVYVGSSAGSMVVGRRISTHAYRTVYGEEDDYGVTDYCDLVNFAIKPHLGSRAFPNNRKEILLNACEDFNGTIYALDDNTALVVEGSRVYAIGNRPFKIVH